MLRVYSAKIVNYFLHHPDIVSRYLEEGTKPPVIEAKHLQQGGLLAYLLDNTLFLLYDRGNNAYEGDIFALPQDRGKKAVSQTKEMVNYLFKIGVDKVILQVLREDRATQVLVTAVGFKRVGSDDECIFYDVKGRV